MLQGQGTVSRTFHMTANAYSKTFHSKNSDVDLIVKTYKIGSNETQRACSEFKVLAALLSAQMNFSLCVL